MAKVIISGGGTGGHIFPAIAIANALKKKDSSIEILFVGALGKIEMDRVPAAGYKIIGLPVAGFQRRITLSNITFFFKLVRSLWKAKSIINEFKPDVVIGVGGYASGPVLKVAQKRGIPTLIQEQNSYAGVTNKLLAQKASKICVAYEDMQRFFPAEKIILTGNPVRKDLISPEIRREDAASYFRCDIHTKTILILGGSGGARTINECVLKNLGLINEKRNIQIIWQTGKAYFETANVGIQRYAGLNVRVFDFITRMDYAYCLADVVISRAGASTIAELCVSGKPSVLVPSPNVAEDHQTKNAMALVNKNAALLAKDDEAEQRAFVLAFEILAQEKLHETLKQNVLKLAIPNADERIADEVLKLIKK